MAYEVPMAVVEVGKTELPMAGGFSKPEQIYDTPCADIHPREVQDWFCSWDENKAVTISSDVAAFDWVNPTDNDSEEIVLQPILLATRRSCNGSSDANWYLQRGNHHFNFSLTSFGSNWFSPSDGFNWNEGRPEVAADLEGDALVGERAPEPAAHVGGGVVDGAPIYRDNRVARFGEHGDGPSSECSGHGSHDVRVVVTRAVIRLDDVAER